MAPRAARLAACVALLASLASPAFADRGRGDDDGRKGLRSEGCVAIGTHQAAISGIRPYDCRYVATGPSTYVASTSNPFVIAIWDEEHERWNEVVRRAAPGPPTSGEIASKPGDLVTVSISCWDYTAQTWCRDAIGGRYGAIAIHSRI